MPGISIPPTGLPGKYRPTTLTEVRGQPFAVAALQSFILEENPAPAAFLFHGPSGVGKTAAAFSLAADLGCEEEWEELGGIFEIPSGDQDGAAVKKLLAGLRMRPLYGSGWKVVIVNEADYMTRQAEVIWLDALENLPPQTVVIFTTNDVAKLPGRLVGRCEMIAFSGEPEDIHQAMVEKVREVWEGETGEPLPAIPDGLGRLDLFTGTLSIRLAIQQVAPYARTRQPLPKAFVVPMDREGTAPDYSTAAKKAAATRKANATRKAVPCG
jgi:hypothetical protein